MAYIYRAKDGNLMFSKTKPEKIFNFTFKNNQIHPEGEERYDSTKTLWCNIKVSLREHSFNKQGYCFIENELGQRCSKPIHKSECVFEYDYTMGFPVTFRSETIAALKPIVDLSSLTVEDGLIEI